MSAKSKAQAADRQQRMEDTLTEVQNSTAAQLSSWNSYLETMRVPGDLYPALMTGRTELLDILQPKDLSKEECAAMMEVIKVLVKTNMALQAHAKEVARLVETWSSAFKQLHNAGSRITAFANFRNEADDEDDDGYET